MPDIVASRQIDLMLPTPPIERRTLAMPLAQLVRRSLPLMVFSALLFGAAAFLTTTFLMSKRYTTSGIVSVQTQSFAIPELEGAIKRESLPDPMPVVRSEVQVLQSPALIRDVVTDLNLKSDPEFNGALRPPGVIDRAKSWIAARLSPELREQAQTWGLLPKPGSTMSDAQITDGVVAAVAHDLGIINDNRSLIITVQFTAENPDVAARVVNTVIKRYMDGKIAARAATNKEANATLRQRVKEVRQEVEDLEARMQQTRQKYNLVQTRAGSVGQQQLEDLSASLTKASSDRAQLEATYSRASTLARSNVVDQATADMLSSSTISLLRDREATAARQAAQLSSSLGPGHPDRRAAEAELASARGALASEARRGITALGAQVQAARQRETDVRKQLADAQVKASSLATVQGELTQLEKDADARRTLYATLLQRAEQTDKAGPEQSGAMVVSEATAPITPSSPRPKLAAALGVVGGLAFGGFLGLLRKQESASFAEADEVAAETGLSPLATIPRLSTRAGSRSLATAILSSSAGPPADALRLLRTRLRFVGRGTVPRSVLFTSSVHGEGASSVAASFARMAALDGLRVLLVEGDLQKPSLARILDLPPSNGIVESLQGRADWRDMVVRDTHTPLECLIASGVAPEAGGLLESMQLQNLLAEASDDYNLVVIDSHAVGSAAHSMALAHAADAVVLVVASGEAARRDVRSAIDALTRAARKPPTFVINKA